ncbi:hypothetical protein [Thermomonas aquatica]|uniref:STAS/SEC14 domain-containing protein n=1 Tax=Thermomonas aquatica TaxID=2202149 RepID=A0A5B7ZTU8_9GAMM|nr:hypothetical protein [Thermomonas aquatica]QDA58378.1 hypothetical protein FHQ07_14210 [Thermomonas aquatica]
MSNTRVVNGPGFRICYDDEPDYLRAYVFDGTDSLEVSSAMWRMLGDECRASAAGRLLVLEDLLSTVDVPGIGQVVDAMFAAGLADVRIAFVELRDDIEGSELGESMCLERGMTIRVFSQEPVARRWLIYGD